MDIYSITNSEGEKLSKTEINDMLQDLGISDDAIKQGTSDAVEEDAEKQGITNLDAQVEAKVKKDGISGASDSAKKDYESELKADGVPDDVIKKGSAAVQEYAQQNAINLPKATGTTLNLNF